MALQRSPATNWASLKLRASTYQPSPRAISWLVFAGFIAFACWFTWPLVLDMRSSVYGEANGGDLGQGIATLGEWAHGFPFLPGRYPNFGAPEGTQIPWPLNIANFSFLLPMWLLAVAFGPVFAFNACALTGHILTAQATFLLARRLTNHVGASIISGWAYAFFPFMVINSRGHSPFIHGWVFVLLLWRMIIFRESPSRRNGLLAGSAAVICWAWNPYFLLFGGVLALVLVLNELIRAQLSRSLRRSVIGMAWGLAPISAYFIIVGIASSLAETPGTRYHSLDELTVYAARSYEYFVPHDTSLLFSDLTRGWLAAHAHGSNYTETTLYLGISVLLLATVGLWATLSGRFRSRDARGQALLLIGISVTAFGMSAPPSIHIPLIGWVHMPAYYIYEITSSWRVYSRFVLVVMLGVVLLAAYGIAWLMNRRSRIISSIILLLVFVAIPVDLWQQSGHGWVRAVGHDPIYDILENQQPRGIVAEYPIAPFGRGDPPYLAETYQTVHGMPILNGFGENTPEEWRALTLAKLSDPQTAKKLATLGVRYVLKNHLPIPSNVGIQDPGPPGPGFRVIASTQYATLYRVTARPAPAIVIGYRGFGGPEPFPGSPQWLGGDSGKIEIRSACDSCIGTLRFRVSSLAEPRVLTLSTRGKHLRTITVSLKGSDVAVPIRVKDRSAYVQLDVSPGPERISDVRGGPDNRVVSVYVGNMSFVPASGSSR